MIGGWSFVPPFSPPPNGMIPLPLEEGHGKPGSRVAAPKQIRLVAVLGVPHVLHLSVQVICVQVI